MSAIDQYTPLYFEQVASKLQQAETEDEKEGIYARTATIAIDIFAYLEEQFSLPVKDPSDFQAYYDTSKVRKNRAPRKRSRCRI